MVFVRILAYVPLVMAVLPYVRAFQAWRQRRANHVPEQQAEAVPNEPDAQRIERTPPHGEHGAPNEPVADWHERTPLLAGAQQQSVVNGQGPQRNPQIPLAEVTNYESTFYTAPEQLGVESDRYSTARESVIV